MGSFLRTVIRRALFLTVALSTLACVALSCLWWWSYRGGQGRVTLETERRLLEASTHRGRVQVQIILDWPGMAPGKAPGMAARNLAPVFKFPTARGERHFLDASYYEGDLAVSQERDDVQLAAARDSVVVSSGRAPWTFLPNRPVVRVLWVPYAYLVFLAGLPLALCAFIGALRAPARVRLARRRRRGECVHCGYDLRFSRGRCPECAEPIPPRAGG
jgi:hypothetical protein